MAKAKKPKVPKEPKPKKAPAVNVFDLIKGLTVRKRKWEELTPEEQKGFNVFRVNQALSMNLYLCELINNLQVYNLGMDKDKAWRLFYEILPVQNLYAPWVKAQSKKPGTEEELEAIKKHFHVNEENAIMYFDILSHTPTGRQKIQQLVKTYE